MRCFVVCSLVLACLAGGAQAQLVDLGDATRDPATGLDWLDLTQSLGLTYDEVLNGVGNDLAARGWRHATAAEVCTLFETYALAPTPCGVDNRSASRPDTGAVQGLIDLFGDTGAVIAVSSTPPHDPVVVGSAGLHDDGGSPAAVGEATLGLHVSQDLELTSVFVEWITPITTDPTRGHFLVRPAPEPGAMARTGAAALVLAGLGGAARGRSQSGPSRDVALPAGRG